MTENRIASFLGLGQSIWLDYISRDLLQSGELKALIGAGEITGVTSNPTIFDKAIRESTQYDDQLRQTLEAKPESTDQELFEALAIQDIQETADLLAPVYEKSQKDDGYVSLEVSPELATFTEETFEETQRLFRAVDRPNVMIKIPATQAGLPAITRAIREGININVTLMFSIQDYKDVAESYLKGLEQRVIDGKPIEHVASVASFFVSRVDNVIDSLLPPNSPLRGKIAVANAKLAYQAFEKTFTSDRFSALRLKRAKLQRILWGSTRTKNPAYSDLLYVEPLVGPHSVNTVPPITLEAIRDHGVAKLSVTQDVESSEAYIHQLSKLGISLEDVTKQLKGEGVKAFAESFRSLLKTLKTKRGSLLAELSS